jgi:hypothetical protein
MFKVIRLGVFFLVITVSKMGRVCDNFFIAYVLHGVKVIWPTTNPTYLFSTKSSFPPQFHDVKVRHD